MREKERGARAEEREGGLRIREEPDRRDRARVEMREHPLQREKDRTELRKTAAGMGAGRRRERVRRRTEPARDESPGTALAVRRGDRAMRPNVQVGGGKRGKMVKEKTPFHVSRKIPGAGGRESDGHKKTLG